MAENRLQAESFAKNKRIATPVKYSTGQKFVDTWRSPVEYLTVSSDDSDQEQNESASDDMPNNSDSSNLNAQFGETDQVSANETDFDDQVFIN